MTDVLELRVHGVSNTPPQDLLRELGLPDAGAEDLERVAGDERTGFYRRAQRGAAPVPGAPGTTVTTEAYSWGALTAGDRARKDLERAGWALLLPFALANVALWARPEVPSNPKEETLWDRATAYVIRLLALSLTCTLVVAVASVAMDQVAWQCGQGEGCPRAIPRTDFLHEGGTWAQGMRPVALAALVPVLLLGAMGLLARRSFAYEAELPETTSSAGGSGPCESALECTTFWRGDGQVRRLALLHLSAGLATVAGLLALTTWFARPDGERTWATALGAVAGVGVVVALAGVALVLNSDQVRYRGSAPGSALPSRGYGTRSKQVMVVAVGALVVAMVYAAAPARPGLVRADALPGFAGAFGSLAAAQLLALLVLWAMCVHRARGVRARGEEAGLYEPGRAPAAWGGAGSAVLAGLGLLLGYLYSAGLVFFTADWLNGGATVTSPASAVHLPPVLLWSGFGLLLVGAALLVLLGCALRVLPGELRAHEQEVKATHGVDESATGHQHEARRARAAARWRLAHDVVGDRLLGWVGWASLAILVGATACATLALVTEDPPAELADSGWVAAALKWLTDTGAAAAGLVLVGLVVLVGATYRGAGPRKTLGIVWDLATFWPRGAHPFAPPCYAERVVPQIVTRVTGLAPTKVVLAGHSQGALISAAAVAQLRAQRRTDVFLLTFGTQLDKLYGQVFPAVLGPARRDELAGLLTTDADAGPRWRSLHRPTDPLGWQVGRMRSEQDGEVRWYADVDVPVRDPRALPPYDQSEPSIDDLRPSGGEVLDPPVRQHSDYACSPEYAAARAHAVRALTGRPPTQPVGPAATGAALPRPRGSRMAAAAASPAAASLTTAVAVVLGSRLL